jgi:hypothetical protein
MLRYLILGAAVLGVTSAANAECIPNTTLRERDPNTASYIYETKRGDLAISVYRKGESFEEFVEVKRVGRCIEAIEPITADQFVSRYLEYPEAWIAEQEGADNEGMPAEGDEVAEQLLSEEQQFPFLSLEGRAIPQNLIYKGPVGRPDFNGRDKKFANYRTRILEGMSEGVNFSGDYSITQIGCGSSCSFAILSNLRTGEQFNFPRGGEAVGPLSLKFSANSSLMISTWKSDDDCVLESLQFDGKKWVTLAKPSLGAADLCYDGIDDNIKRYKSQNGASDNSRESSLAHAGSSPANISPVIPSRTETMGNKTAFRGLHLGMSKEQAMSLQVDGFSPEFRKKVEYEGGFKIPSHVNFLSASGDICASANLGDASPVIEQLELSECFFFSKGANLHQFSKKFADSYDVGSMAGSVKQRSSSTVEEAYEGETKFGEVIKIYKVTGLNNKLNRIEDPIKIDIKTNHSKFD